MTVGVGRKVDQPVNGQLRSLFARTDLYNMCITAHGAYHAPCSILPALSFTPVLTSTCGGNSPYPVMNHGESSPRSLRTWLQTVLVQAGGQHSSILTAKNLEPTTLDILHLLIATKKMLSIRGMNCIFDKGQNWHNAH